MQLSKLSWQELLVAAVGRAEKGVKGPCTLSVLFAFDSLLLLTDCRNIRLGSRYRHCRRTSRAGGTCCGINCCCRRSAIGRCRCWVFLTWSREKYSRFSLVWTRRIEPCQEVMTWVFRVHIGRILTNGILWKIYIKIIILFLSYVYNIEMRFVLAALAYLKIFSIGLQEVVQPVGFCYTKFCELMRRTLLRANRRQ